MKTTFGQYIDRFLEMDGILISAVCGISPEIYLASMNTYSYNPNIRYDVYVMALAQNFAGPVSSRSSPETFGLIECMHACMGESESESVAHASLGDDDGGRRCGRHRTGVADETAARL